MLTALLAGKGERAHDDVVALNAGALLMTAGVAQELAEAVETARDAIASGAAKRVLDAFVEASNG